MRKYGKYLILNNYFERQRGQALLVLLILLVLGGGAAFYFFLSPNSAAIEKDKITAAALAQAKAALIGYAAGVTLSGASRLGDLPCPDTDDSGQSGTSCGNAAGTTGQTSRIGRLPWRSLGLPDLRDGDGERLWYAVSRNFKNNFRSTCASPGDAGCLNSDTRGTITVRNNTGITLHDGSNPDAHTPSGVIAVIFAPGGVLQRQGAVTAQDRSCNGGSCSAAGVCTSAPLTDTAKCNPANYLDVVGPPALTVTDATACNGTAGDYDCLAVSPPTASTVDNKRFVVVVAGKRLSTVAGGQPRTAGNKDNPANYLEDENGNNTGTSNIYGQQLPTTTFNDTLLFLQ